MGKDKANSLKKKKSIQKYLRNVNPSTIHAKSITFIIQPSYKRPEHNNITKLSIKPHLFYRLTCTIQIPFSLL